MTYHRRLLIKRTSTPHIITLISHATFQTPITVEATKLDLRPPNRNWVESVTTPNKLPLINWHPSLRGEIAIRDPLGFRGKISSHVLQNCLPTIYRTGPPNINLGWDYTPFHINWRVVNVVFWPAVRGGFMCSSQLGEATDKWEDFMGNSVHLW